MYEGIGLNLEACKNSEEMLTFTEVSFDIDDMTFAKRWISV